MNTFLLTTITVTVALVYGYNPGPCQKNDDNNAYKKFVRKHILKWYFDRSSKPEWKRYLNETGLCNRRFQSFIRKRDQMSVVSVCNGHGRPLSCSYPGNLCISDSRMLVYHVKVSRDARCNIEYLASKNESVIVACDKIVNRCRPVHLEGYRGQKPDPKARHCRP